MIPGFRRTGFGRDESTQMMEEISRQELAPITLPSGQRLKKNMEYHHSWIGKSTISKGHVHWPTVASYQRVYYSFGSFPVVSQFQPYQGQFR